MSYDVQTLSVFSTLYINVAIGGAFLILFELLRKNYDIFAPKPKWNDNPYVPNVEPAKGRFAWISQLVSMYDEDVISISGMDAYVMIRYLRMLFIAFSWCAFFACVVLIPCYYTAPGNALTSLCVRDFFPDVVR
jgi:hypothetical protein